MTSRFNANTSQEALRASKLMSWSCKYCIFATPLHPLTPPLPWVVPPFMALKLCTGGKCEESSFRMVGGVSGQLFMLDVNVASVAHRLTHFPNG